MQDNFHALIYSMERGIKFKCAVTMNSKWGLGKKLYPLYQHSFGEKPFSMACLVEVFRMVLNDDSFETMKTVLE